MDVKVRNIQSTSNWCEWIGLWESTVNLQLRKSLIHEGFKISLGRREFGEREYDETDRLIFYFAVADGWTDNSLLRFPEDGNTEYCVGFDDCGNRIIKTPSELRQELAQKAFDILRPNFFQRKGLVVENRRDGEFGEEWYRLIISERFFPVIRNFFGIQRGEFNNRFEIRNLYHHQDGKRSHSERSAIEFLINLAKFLWQWREPDTSWMNSDRKKEDEKRFAPVRSRIDAAKPWMTEILFLLNRLDVLREWILELDKACLAKLKEIALRSELSDIYHPVAEDRLVVTLDEARYVDSKAAWFLEEYQLKKEQYERLTAIQEAEQKKANADREIKKLTNVKK